MGAKSLNRLHAAGQKIGKNFPKDSDQRAVLVLTQEA
jgi:hypothetical protein